MARCENCKVDKKHRNSTYIQTVKKDDKRALPPETRQCRHSWTLLQAVYFCHECIRNHWYVRKRIKKELKREDVDHKILRAIPEMDERAEGRAGGKAVH